MIVILHNIRSAYNVGSIFRTADAVGAKKVYLCGITPSPLDRFGAFRREFSKVSLGAEQYLPWEKCNDISRLIAKLKKDGYRIFAVEQSKRATPLYRIKLSKKELERTALILGEEVRGIHDALLKKADNIIEIPMFGKKESLNVSVAFGIAAFALKINSLSSR